MAQGRQKSSPPYRGCRKTVYQDSSVYTRALFPCSYGSTRPKAGSIPRCHSTLKYLKILSRVLQAATQR